MRLWTIYPDTPSQTISIMAARYERKAARQDLPSYVLEHARRVADSLWDAYRNRKKEEGR